jgi:hypothetical protein
VLVFDDAAQGGRGGLLRARVWNKEGGEQKTGGQKDNLLNHGICVVGSRPFHARGFVRGAARGSGWVALVGPVSACCATRTLFDF